MPHPADVYELTSLWLEGTGRVGWAAVLGEMALDELAPGTAQDVDPDTIGRPGPEA